ncbi:hypothetical protein CC1G_04573 [Coprinopsis cinerea okayama7|uniref:rRNA-processing protein EFG1 n=1 Tax=Coprinopsis cinerea (strain Okayama-7 / 130 / ATCC MYA-4618 / FGSC 9003) TaxID=240176 RepID=EFG1P_COPC7|nr:hypothetical protein CC1G_04573 [Coprinopsis cinerea okayama7\|eukprot:XP_001830140.1 hypothetical protein CC1G_04573 [Coprinopsis cinerea okayama7\
MAPIRTKDKHKNAEASSSKSNKSHKKKPNHQPKASALPGKQKIKSSLRQVRRLLAKENLAADKRVEAERRLKALEAELQQVEQAHKERALAIRYHKVKFFERQKVTRKLNQVKRRLDSADGSEKEQLEAQLLEERVNLNYILHYPKTKKYISLFPPEVRKGEVTEASKTDAEKTNREREEIRQWIRDSMEKKELPSEPETQLGSGPGRPQASTQFPSKKSSNPVTKSGVQSSKPGDDIEDDEFFGNDSEDDGNEVEDEEDEDEED